MEIIEHDFIFNEKNKIFLNSLIDIHDKILIMHILLHGNDHAIYKLSKIRVDEETSYFWTDATGNRISNMTNIFVNGEMKQLSIFDALNRILKNLGENSNFKLTILSFNNSHEYISWLTRFILWK